MMAGIRRVQTHVEGARVVVREDWGMGGPWSVRTKVMEMRGHCTIQAGVVVLVLGALVGCSYFDRPLKSPTGKTADQLSKEGNSQMEQRNYRQAIETFYKLKYDFPSEAAAIMADLKIADAHYSNKEYLEATEGYEEVRKMHPASPYIPYVVYMLGLCHYQRIISVDRDQTSTEKALNEFRYVLTHYPNTPYAYDANEKAQDCLKKLSDHEINIGNFYYRTGKYTAAILRYEAAISKYPSVPLDDETLISLVESYERTQQPEKAQKALDVLRQQHPKSKYAQRSVRMVKASSEPAPPAAASPQPPPASPPASQASPTTSSVPVPPPPPPVAPQKAPQAAPVTEEPGAQEGSTVTAAPPMPSEALPPPAPHPQPPSSPAMAAEKNGAVRSASAPGPRPSAPPPSDSPPEAAGEAISSEKSSSVAGDGPMTAPEPVPTPVAGLAALSGPTARVQEPPGPPARAATVAAEPEVPSSPAPPSETTRGTALAAPAESSPKPPSPSAPEVLSARAPTRDARASETTPAEAGPKEIAGNPTLPGPPKKGATKGAEESMGFGELRGDRPINITADRMDAYQRENRVVFEGNVVVQQDDTYLYARRILADIASQDSGGGIRKVVAQQDVRITQNDRVATCDRAEFDHIRRTIELSGKPKIWQGKDWIDGDKVLVQLDQEKMTIVGSEQKRVSAVLHPKERKDMASPAGESAPTKPGRPSLTAPFAPAPADTPSPAERPNQRAKALPEGQEPAALPVSQRTASSPTSGEREGPVVASAIQSPAVATEAPVATGARGASASPSRASSAVRPDSSGEPSPGVAPSPAKEVPTAVPSLTRVEDEAARIASEALRGKEPGAAPREASSPAVEREKRVSPVSSTQPQESVEAFLEKWKRAWESKNLDQYMAFYSRRFQSGKWDWNGWRNHKADIFRRTRIIEVVSEGVEVERQRDGVRVSFLQRYRADSHQDRGRKDLHLIAEDGLWKIIGESWSQLASGGTQSQADSSG
jgi:outer membrane protein assembly factor BamD